SVEPLGPKRPRIDLQQPEKSLVLLKPTAAIPHGGGRRFEAESRDYRTVLDWVRAGAPYGEAGDEGRIVRVEVSPRDSVLEKNGKQQLAVRAWLEGGRREDISGEVLYVSNNPEVVRVSPAGTVEAVGKGEATVMVRAPGVIATAHFGVIANRLVNYPA